MHELHVEQSHLCDEVQGRRPPYCLVSKQKACLEKMILYRNMTEEKKLAQIVTLRPRIIRAWLDSLLRTPR